MSIVRRLLALGWEYRARCLAVFAIQLALLVLGLSGLGLTGIAIDVIRHALEASAPPPRARFVGAVLERWPPMYAVAFAGGLVLVMAAVRAGLNYGYSLSVGKLVHMEVVPALRAKVYDKLQRLSFRFFDANSSGSLINRVTGDVQLVRSFIDGVLIQSGIMILSLGVYLLYMLQTDVRLTVACLSPTPLLWMVSALFSRRVQPAYAENRKLFDRMVLTFSETMQGIHVVKGLGREREAERTFAERNERVRSQQQRIFRRVSLFSPTVDLLGQTHVVILLAYGGLLVAKNRITLGELLVFAGLLQQFSGQVANMAAIVNAAQQSLIGARRVFEVLDAPIEVKSPPSPLVPAGLSASVRFESVTFGYERARPVLRDVTLEVEPGQLVAIVGPTGAGKSTLLSLIPRFYDPSHGRVLVGGFDVRELDLDWLRRRVGLVFQENFLFSNTVAANIAFGAPGATRAQIERAARIAQAHDFVCELPNGYDTVLGDSGSNLSGGQRQRLAIARALLLDPPLLLLDDPTAALDANTEREIFDAIERASEGRTTFFVTHRPHVLARADRVVVMNDGRIIAHGRHHDLARASEHYAKVLSIHDDALDPAVAAPAAPGAAREPEPVEP